MGRPTRRAQLNAAAAARMQARREDDVRLYVLVLLLTLVVVLIAVGYQHAKARLRHYESISCDNWVVLCEAIAKYKQDQPDAHTPQTLAELVERGYLKALPINPFSQQPMRALRVCEPSSPGDYSYYPARIRDVGNRYLGPWTNTGYYLLVYSTSRHNHPGEKTAWRMDANVRRLLPHKRILALEIAGNITGFVKDGPYDDASFEPLKDVLLKYEGQIKNTY
jgi:hypothetical protein